jgi:phage terminase large subunit-like protein
MKRCYNYCEAIETGSIAGGRYIKLAVQRFRRDLLREDLEYREDEAQRVINFIEILEHSTGKFAGTKFILEDWQVFIVASIYGFYYKDTNKRKYNTSYIEVARKNGKSFLISALGLYHLMYDGEDSAEVLLAANSKEQAKIVFDLATKTSKRLDAKEKYLKKYRSEIKFKSTDSVLKVLAADDTKLDGFNASFGVLDEYHSAPTSKVRDVIRSSMGMRENPHLCTITTAGFNKNNPCYQLRRTCTEILECVKEDDSLFALIYSLDEGDDWRNPDVWVKANPNLGVTVKLEFIETQVKQALNNPSDEVGVRTKNLNEWVDSGITWLPESLILANTKNINIDDFDGNDVYIGIDLSSNQDLTSVSYMFPKDNKFYWKTDFYIPQQSLETRADKDLYRDWVRRGYVKLTSGNVTDYDYILKDILDVSKKCNIIIIGYDKYNATQFAINATNEGLPLQIYSQSVGNFNSPTRAMERLILDGRGIIDDNPVMRWNFNNVELKQDFNGNIKPSKANAKSKVDGVIAAIQALGVFLFGNNTNYSNEIYVI